MAYTPPRPGVRPVAPPPKKNNNMVIGLGVAGALAVIGLGGAGFLFTQQGGLKTALGVHATAATEAAKIAGVAIDTNAPADWAALWPKVNAALIALKDTSERQSVRIGELEQEVEVAAGLQATLQKAQTDAQRSAQQVTSLTSELDALKASSAAQARDLEAKLAAAQKALDEAKAQLAAAPAVAAPVADAAAPAVESAPAPAAEAPAAAADAPATPAAEPAAAVGASYTFPPGRSPILKAAGYDAASQTMVVTLKDDTLLTYTGVPADVYERLVTVPTFETYYRMKIMGAFAVTPDDKAAVRAVSARR
jgi:hypothetical protein